MKRALLLCSSTDGQTRRICERLRRMLEDAGATVTLATIDDAADVAPAGFDLALLLADPNAHFYVCGLKSMEEGVVLALRDVAEEARLDWATLGPTLKREGRLHLETY